MTRQQIMSLLVINALISLIISLTVVLVFERYRTPPTTLAVAAAGATAQAEEMPAPTPSPTPTLPAPEPVATYIVKSGDSLSSIAYQHDVSLEALMKANNIENADYIAIGQTLIIPAGGSVPTATPTPRELPTLAPLLTPGAEGAPVVIESITMASNPDAEYLTIVNKGAQGVALAGWILEDEDGHSYVFPNLFLWRNGTVLLHTGLGSDSATDLYWGLTERVWDRIGEKARLRDTTGEVVSELVLAEDKQ
ncbi:MAG: LysM peptidoglycan-binding domain-containing protein [Anaerolineae bacterium]